MSDMEVEGARLKNILIRDLLKEDIINYLDKNKTNVEPVAIVFMDKTTKPESPIVINHQSIKEIEQKILHFQSQNPESLQKILSIIKNRKQ